MSRYLLCPHCGTSLVGIRKIYNAIGYVNTDADGKHQYQIQNETSSPSFEVVGCMSCHREISIEDMVDGVKCTKCGRDTVKSDIDENGVCSICRLEEESPDFSNISLDELKRKYYMLMHGEATDKINKKAEEAKAKMENDSQPAPEEKPKKRQVKRKTKKSEEKPAQEETVNEAQDNVKPEEDTQKEQEQVANQQDAPFPSGVNNLFDEPAESTENIQPNSQDVMPELYDDTEDAV